jgi:hypothetical protein
MKKFIILLLTALMINLSVNAQETIKRSGWSVGFETGLQTNLHDWNAPQGAVLGININKDFNPYYGLSFEVTTGINNRRNYHVDIYRGIQAFDQITINLNNRWNILNTFYGYNTNRKFDVELIAGIGYLRDFGSTGLHIWPVDDYYLGGHWTIYNDARNAFITKTGFNFNYNFNKNWSVTLQPSIIWDLSKRWELPFNAGNERFLDKRFNNSFNSMKAVFQVMAGITYNFTSKTSKYKELYKYSQGEVNTLNNEINDLKTKNTELMEQLSNSTDSVH